MEKFVVSLRVPSLMSAALEESAVGARMSVAEALDWLLLNSLGNFEVLRGLNDCSEPCDAKLDARVAGTTLDSLRAAAAQLRVSPSVYTRTLLYHVFITEQLTYMNSGGHYTLACRHD
jgi:hypothetical protein